MASVESCLNNLQCGQNDAFLKYAWSGLDDGFNYLCGEAADGRSLYGHDVNSYTIIAIDFSKVFDTVLHSTLFDVCFQFPILNSLYHWFTWYM